MFTETIIVHSRVPLRGARVPLPMQPMGPGDGHLGLSGPDALMALAGGLTITVEHATEADREELRRDPANAVVAETIPISLVRPVSRGAATSAPASAPWGLEAVGALASSWTGEGVRVAVLDSGIDTAHEAFRHIVFHDGNVVDFSLEGPGDSDGHGTHCAGTLFGRSADGVRIGVAPGVTDVLIAKVLGTKGSTSATLFSAMNWALDKKANIISMSLGLDYPAAVEQLTKDGWPQDLAVSKALRAFQGNLEIFNAIMVKIDALNRAGKSSTQYDGTIVIAATGNESRADVNPAHRLDVSMPAACGGVLAVGAVDVSDKGDHGVAPFSNGGCAVCAPGVDILSARAGGGTALMSGTSMATPHAAGVAALWAEKLRSEDLPQLPEAVRARLLSLASRQKIRDPKSFECGNGLVTAPL